MEILEEASMDYILELINGPEDQQLEAKDGQIRELHVLLQQTEAALPAAKEEQPWWRFWQR